MTIDGDGPRLIAAVRQGMRMIDSAGEDVGEVEFVKMGEPDAVTAQGQRVGEPYGIVDAVAETVTGAEPDVPGELAAQLLRVGYVKVDGKGLRDVDRYVASDQIADVTADTVRLHVTRGQLAAET